MSLKTIILLFLCLTFNLNTYADIIDSVAIVRPILGEEGKVAYQSVAKWLENSRSLELKEIFENKMESGSFGSGFVLDGSRGEKYIITNFHVISESSMANVEFQDHDGNSVIYEDCPVLIADENKDLAILLIDESQHDRPLIGLNLNTELQVEGVDVWTAGFPGFGKDPLWQLAKGSVTNRKARTNELKVNALEYVIQHSSIIDGGSSGGPLLLRNKNEAAGFTVIGINTWSALGRDNTYFSIPAKSLDEMLKRLPEAIEFEDDEEKLLDELEKTAIRFASSFSEEEDDYLSHRTFFSHEIVFDKGWKRYYNRRKEFTSDERTEWDNRFFHGDSYFVMKDSTYKDMREYLKNGDNSLLEYNRIEKKDEFLEGGSSEVYFIHNNQEILTSWKIQYGEWKIESIDIESISKTSEKENSEKKEGSNKVLRKTKKRGAFVISPNLPISFFSVNEVPLESPLSPKVGVGIDVEFEGYTSNYFAWIFKLGLMSLSKTDYDYSDSSFYEAKSLKLNFIMGVKFQLPLSLGGGDLFLTPYISGGLGANLNLTFLSSLFGGMMDSSSGSYITVPLVASAGLDFGIGKYKDSFQWGFEASFIYNLDISGYSDIKETIMFKPSIHVKFLF